MSSDGAGNWCLIESDPGVFTELIQKFGKHWTSGDSVVDLNYFFSSPQIGSTKIVFEFVYGFSGNFLITSCIYFVFCLLSMS
jgi:hypothetical protein